MSFVNVTEALRKKTCPLAYIRTYFLLKFIYSVVKYILTKDSWWFTWASKTFTRKH